MPTIQTVDFAATAKRIAHLTNIDDIEAALRGIWNARGAMDIAQIETDLSMMMGTTTSGPYLKNLELALRKLDRT